MARKRTGKHIILLFLASAFTLFIQGQKAGISVSPVLVKKGSPFNITVSMENLEGIIELPEDGFINQGMIDQSMNITFYKGKQIEQQTFTYQAIPTKEGKITIGPAMIKTKKGVVRTNTVTIEVSDTKDLILIPNPQKEKFYLGEPIITNYTYYTLNKDAYIFSYLHFDQSIGLVNSIKLTTKPAFTIRNYNGKSYYSTAIGRSVYLPLTTGKVRLPKGSTVITINKPSDNGLEDYFGIGFSLQEQRYLESEPRQVEVIPLPTENMPQGFDNAVGDFGITLGADRTDVNSNDGIKLRVHISGYGNLVMLRPPDLNLPLSIKSYLPETIDSIEYGSFGMMGSRTFEYILIPRSGGDFTIGPVPFIFFDPQREVYETIYSDSISFHVQGRIIPDDSLELMNSLDTAMIMGPVPIIKLHKPAKEELWGSPVFWSLNVLAILLTALLIWKRDKIHAWDALMAERKKQKSGKAWVAALRKHSGDIESFRMHLLKAGYWENVPSNKYEAVRWFSRHYAAAASPVQQFFDTYEKLKYSGQLEPQAGELKIFIRQIQEAL